MSSAQGKSILCLINQPLIIKSSIPKFKYFIIVLLDNPVAKDSSLAVFLSTTSPVLIFFAVFIEIPPEPYIISILKGSLFLTIYKLISSRVIFFPSLNILL